ncbi:hypothetical protein BGX20_004118 [Mortierella sp. AD010]|nr:hypothetical protein BGX20_004118 [Mortierella sp. AD010]
MRRRAEDIVADVEVLVKTDIERLFIALKFRLITQARAHVAIVVRGLGVNLFLEQIHIQNSVDVMLLLLSKTFVLNNEKIN